jgi:flagella synthesis protein FlgN
MTLAAETGMSSTLPGLLASERDTIARFIDLFKREEASLRQGGSDDIFRLVIEKEALASQLSDITAQRCAWLAGQGLTPDRQGIEAWCASHPEAGEALGMWSEIVALAGEARELQRLNGELIAIHMRYNAQALEALQRDTKPLDLYGPDGQSKASGARRINDAV